jgi:hypothetical protein
MAGMKISWTDMHDLYWTGIYWTGIYLDRNISNRNNFATGSF